MAKNKSSVNSCPLCGRNMINGPSIDDHHLIPKTFKGTEKIRMHKICHTKIHTSISERELQHYYHTIERLLEHEEIQKFIKWVKNKSPEFYVKNKDTRRRRTKRQ